MDWGFVCGSSSLIIWVDDNIGTCFSHLALCLPASLVLTAVSSYYIGKEYNWVLRNKFQNIVLNTRAIICLGLALIPLFELAGKCYRNESLFLIDFFICFIPCFAWLSHLIYVIILKQRVSRSLRGPLLALFAWILTVVPCVFQLRKEISNFNEHSKSCFVFWLEVLKAVLQLFYLITLIPHGMASVTGFDTNFQSFADENINQHLISYSRFGLDTDQFYLGIARDEITFLSRLFLSWVRPLMTKGSQHLLKSSDDLYDMPRRSCTHLIVPHFERQMEATGSIVTALHRCFAGPFYLMGILKFFGDSLSFVGPLLLGVLVQFIDDQTEPVLFGYICAAALCLASFIGSLCNVHFNFGIAEISLRMRAVIISTIYSKTLRVNTANLSQFSSGEIVNMMSTDTERIVNFCASFHAFWSLPFQVGVTLYLLYVQVGLAFLAGLTFAVLLIPINRLVAVKVGNYSTRLMEAKDKRVKLVNELLAGIKVIKFYAWEKHFQHKVEGLRKEELKALKGRKYLDAVCVYFWATTPVLIAILTFTTYILMGGTLNSAKVFTCVALFNMLISPLNALPWVLSGLVEAWVSLKRVRNLIELPNLDLESYYDKVGCDQTAVAMNEAQFSWQNSVFQLTGVDVHLKKGQFIGVIGQVGSGKTAFLQAIIGDMIKLDGKIAINNTEGLAIVTQEPWIQHGTIRDNILFGKSYDAAKYRAVLEVCALNADLRALPEGDQTVLGDNGVTLSGGQKARITLARAVYQDKDIYLLDDVLSAVDSQVAKYLVEFLLFDYLKNKTRILCTHHVQYLQSADWILVFQEGRLVSQGTPADIFGQVLDSDAPDGVLPTDVNNETEERETGILQDEERSEGTVKLDVYSAYWKAVGLYVTPIILASLLLMQTSKNVCDWWLAHWVSPSVDNTTNVTSSQDPVFYLSVYGGIAAANSVFTLIRAFAFAYGGLKAAELIHKRLMDTILKGKMVFFDVTPFGRILNRLSSDIYTIDDSLPFILNIFLAQVFGLIGTLVVTCVGIPWMCLLLLPLGFIYFNLQHYYRNTSRELKRLSTVTLSPIYSQFSETLSGLVTIRATQSSARFIRENQDLVENNNKTQFASQAAAQWLNLRLQLIGVAMVTGVALLAVIQHHVQTVNSGLVGLAITYALSITTVLSGVVTAFVESEKEMVSVERVHDYIDRIPTESTIPDVSSVPLSWPAVGVVVFDNVSMRYREHFPYSLRSVSFETRPSEKVGIVGRTGSGKSSLFQVLFRLVDHCSGDIRIDDVSIKSLNLHDLRSRIAIIPQDPFIFSGTIGDNLDPTGQFTEQELWNALELCHLAERVANWGGLSTDVLERGKLLSTGQKQLLCLARALLLKAKVICVDEATASVDLETDRLIQQTIRRAFQSSTVLTIAHRTETIMDSDRVIVMSAGQIVECDTPSKLLENTASHFYKLVNY